MRALIDPILTLPAKGRRKTFLFMVPVFAMFDVALAIMAVTLTHVNIQLWIENIPLVTENSIVTRGFVLLNGLFLFGYLQVLYARWVMNRKVL